MSYEIRVFDQNRKRLAVARERFGVLSATEDLYGAYGEFSLDMNARTVELSALQPQCYIEQWVDNRRLYRGYILRRGRQVGDPDKLRLTGHGRSYDLSKILCTARVFVSGELELSDLVSKIITLWVRPIFGTLEMALDINTTGVKVTSYDCTGKSVKQVLDELCDLTAGAVHWGCIADADGKDLLYLRLVGQQTHVISVPGREVTAATAEIDAEDLVNRLRFTGGDLAVWRQNLIVNPSFERPVDGGDADSDGIAYGNLLVNPGFEIGGVHSGWGLTGWTQVSGASAKVNGGGDPDAYSGTWSVELSDDTEQAWQNVPVTNGRTYGVRVHMRPSDAYTSGSGRIWLQWYSAGHIIQNNFYPVAVTTAGYVRFEAECLAPSNIFADGAYRDADTCRVYLLCDTGSSIMYDAVSFWEVNAPVQEGWKVGLAGTADYAVDWQATDAKDGVYSVGVDITTLGFGAQVLLSPLSAISVVPGSRLMFYAWFKTIGGAYSWSASLKIYDGGGSLIATQLGSAWVDGSATVGWESRWDEFVIPPNAATAQLSIHIAAGASLYYFDALTLMDKRGVAELAGNPLDLPWSPSLSTPGDDRIYQPDGALSLVWNAQDLVTALEDADVHDSQSVWGVREGTESGDSIVTYTDAKAFAKGYFLRRAKAFYRPTLTLAGGERNLHTGDLVRLVGADGPTLCDGELLPIVRIRTMSDESGVSQTVENNKPTATLSALIRAAAREEVLRRK